MTHRRQNDLVQRARDQRKNATIAERLLWSALCARKLRGKKFRRQHVVGGYIVDFYCHECDLVLEVDGPHHGEADAVCNDTLRTQQLEERGLRVLRITNDDVLNDFHRTLAHIETHLG